MPVQSWHFTEGAKSRLIACGNLERKRYECRIRGKFYENID